MRIYSFLPSATEIVYALGLGDKLCGVTNECDFPPGARGKPVAVESLLDPSTLAQSEIDSRVVQSLSHGHPLYKIDRGLLARQKPDVVITQDLCDVCSVSLRETLKTISDLSEDCEVISLKPRGLDGVLDDIVTVGRACGAAARAERLVRVLQRRIDRVAQDVSGMGVPRVFCVEWYDPIFASGHWVPEMVAFAGGADELALAGRESRRIGWDEVLTYDPEVLVLIPCGFGVGRAVADIGLLSGRDGWRDLTAVKRGAVFAADGSSYFSRPGPRLVDGLEMLPRMFHPDYFDWDIPSSSAVRVSPPLLKAKR
ncbi:MAG: cobalamin-binding protein [Thaumarchaeota archaeon]|nr:cobalamin-binding protein [Nitrososphaerota archaeon]